LKVLLTGANGFVGSHILDRLVERGIPTAILLRPHSDRSFIGQHLASGIDVRRGSIEEPASLGPALEGITHVIHCAGRTKACRVEEFYATNEGGTRNVVEVVNAHCEQVQRLVHISSLAVAGPGTPEAPAREGGPNAPVSHYGRSKLAAEEIVLRNCRTDFTIIRPPAVYGPRDHGFLPLFKAVKAHVLPRTNGNQALSLVYVEDLAETIVQLVAHPAVSRRTYFAAAVEIVTGARMAQEIARQLGTWTIPLPLPAVALWPMCLGQEAVSRITGRARLLNLQKYAELSAPGWVCDPSRLARETGCTCPTNLRAGVGKSLTWYQNHHWL
jgi:nucleoside-diphosphate-sugar epimerase